LYILWHEDLQISVSHEPGTTDLIFSFSSLSHLRWQEQQNESNNGYV
jgi:hypothetical protein